MSVITTGASPWPARCAYLSAAIFTVASGGTNLIYGWQKGTDLAGSLVWAGVSGGVAIIFALSWPATIKSFEARRWSAAAMSFVALLLAGAYSVTAALGSAAGGRANAAATETATTDARSKAQAAYDSAKAELDALAVAKPAAEIQALIETAKAELAKLAGRTLCRPRSRRPSEGPSAIRNAMGAPWSMARWHSPARSWTASSLVRASVSAWRRRIVPRSRMPAEAEATRPGAAYGGQGGHGAGASGSWPASSRLGQRTRTRWRSRRYLTAVGLHVTPNRLNDLLALLAVIMVEAGGGLSLAIGMALSGGPEPRGVPRSWLSRRRRRARDASCRRLKDAPVYTAAGGCPDAEGRGRSRRLGPHQGRPGADVHAAPGPGAWTLTGWGAHRDWTPGRRRCLDGHTLGARDCLDARRRWPVELTTDGKPEII